MKIILLTIVVASALFGFIFLLSALFVGKRADENEVKIVDNIKVDELMMAANQKHTTRGN